MCEDMFVDFCLLLFDKVRKEDQKEHHRGHRG